MEALKNVADQLSMGFNTNDENTEDQQIWIISGTPMEFIKETTDKAWKDIDSFWDCWIDVYYNLNFVNIQKILLAREDQIDPAAFLGNLDVEFTWGTQSSQEQTIQFPKVLSNLPAYRTSSNYITSWKPQNRSSAITFDYGTSMICSFYEHLDNLYEDPQSRKYWDLDISPAYDPDKINDHILLRGRANWDSSLNQGERAMANYSYKDIYKKAPWLGVQYTINDPTVDPMQWSGNHHPNYMRAQVHNLINRIELDKLNIEARVRGTNNNIIRGDKLPLVLIKGDTHESQLAHPEENPAQALDFFYTGWYYVKGFVLSWVRDRDLMTSSFSHSFVLTRREWTPPERIDPARNAEPQNNENIVS